MNKPPYEKLIDKVLEGIKEQVAVGDLTAIDELLRFVPKENLIQFLPEEEWAKFSNLKDDTAYAEVSWCAEDVKTIRPNWSLKRCEEELDAIENRLSERLVELGWDVMGDLLPL